MNHTLSREERSNIAHALLHLRANKITDPAYPGGWYCGNREKFISRHVKAIAFLESLLETSVTKENV